MKERIHELFIKQYKLHKEMIEMFEKILLLKEINENTDNNITFCLTFDKRKGLPNKAKAIRQRNKCIRKLKRRYEGYEKEINKISSKIVYLIANI